MPKMSTRSKSVLGADLKPPPTLRKGTADYLLLRDLLLQKRINPGASPKEVQAMRAEFLKYPLPKFRAQLYKLKKETGFNLRQRSPRDNSAMQDDGMNEDLDDDEEEEELMADVGLSAAAGTANDPVSFADVAPTHVEDMGRPQEHNTFKPMVLQATYKDSVNKTDHVVLVIVAPSGVCTSDLSGFKLAVTGKGWFLQCTSDWPGHSMDMDSLHAVLVEAAKSQGENELRDVYKRLEALSDQLSSMRLSDSDVLASTATIPLPIQVSRKIDKVHLLGGKDGSRIVYVDLKAEDSTYRSMESPKVQLIDSGGDK